MTIAELLENYRIARELCDQTSFTKFLNLGRFPEAKNQTVLRDFLCAAGAVYLTGLSAQEGQLIRSKTLDELHRAQASSAELAKSLEKILRGGTLSSRLMEHALDERENLKLTHGVESDTYRVISAIFPFDANGHGLRETGLVKTVEFLADALKAIQDDEIEKTSKGRLQALISWLSVLAPAYTMAKGMHPRVGHYHGTDGDYDSPDVAALTFAIQKIDPDVSSRLVADAISEVNRRFEDSVLNPAFGFAQGLTIITSSGLSHTPKEVWKEFRKESKSESDVSDDAFERFWGATKASNIWGAEQALISNEQFFETLKSSDDGKMLLQALMDNIPK